MSENKLSNPAPLGLMGFGMTTVLLNLVNAGITNLTVVILSMGLAFGGLAQIIAGILEYKRGNTFGTVAFSSYGFFWWSLVFIFLLPNSSLSGAAPAADPTSLGFYMLLWGIFTLFMFFGTLKNNIGIMVVFLTLWILFFLLAIANFTGAGWLEIVAGYEGILCGASAMYVAFAEVLNEVYGKTILPLGYIKRE